MIWFFCLGILFFQDTAFARILGGKTDDKCSGSMQSPIRIVRENTTFIRMQNIRYTGYDVERQNMILENNGHTVKLTLAEGDEKPYIDLGGLGAKYTFKELHFHWGVRDYEGSEHTFSAPYHRALEAHLVHTYPDEAAEGGEKIAVLGLTFVSVSETLQPYAAIINAFKDIRYKDKKTVIGGFSLDSLLLQRGRGRFFYRYDGSLTTPPYTEGVIWSVYEKFLIIGRRQMTEFRTLLSTPEGSAEKPIAPNFRKTQPLNGRTVYRVAGNLPI